MGRVEITTQDQVIQETDLQITIPIIVPGITAIPIPGLITGIILPEDQQGLPFILTGREIFTSGRNQTATGNKDRTEPGLR